MPLTLIEIEAIVLQLQVDVAVLQGQVNLLNGIVGEAATPGSWPWAVAQMRAGNRVTRAAWPAWKWLEIVPGTDDCIRNNGGQPDFLVTDTDDWEILS